MRAVALALAVAAMSCVVPEKVPPADVDVDAGTEPDAGVEDREAPETTITAAPDALTRAAGSTFQFTADEAATFTCSFDGEPAFDCQSPLTRTLPDASHSFSVRATDLAGNPDETPAEHVWTIDSVPPQTTITKAPPAADNSVVVDFEFVSNDDAASFDCSIDSADYAPCASGDAFGPLGDGAHSFAVRARDLAGNTDASPAVHAWAIDSSTPDTDILSGPNGSTSDTGATFTFVSPDAGSGATYQCNLDGASFVACSSPRSYAGLAEGMHAFQVRVRDSVGNLDPTPATRSWTVDLTPPDTSITAGPSGAVPMASASFTFEASEAGVVYECAVDAGAWAACPNPTTLSGLAQGPHTISVRAVDLAGHVDASPAQRTWTVDTVPPNSSITGGPSGTVSDPVATFSLGSNEAGVTFQCSLDAAPFATCPTPYTVTVGEGPHTLEVRAIDQAGNPDTSPATRSWTVDMSGPIVMITSGPAQSSTSGPYVSFGFTVSKGTPSCSVNGGAFVACTSPASYNLAAGPHTFDVQASDPTGNTTTASRGWSVACAPATAGTGAAGLFHLDEASGQTAGNAVGGANAVLGTDATAETSDPARFAPARFGGGLGLVAAEGDRVSWAAGLASVDAHTVELWIRPAAGAGVQDLVASGDARVALRVLAGATTAQVTYTIDASGTPATVTSAAIAVGQWHHVLASFEEPTMRLWVDGVRVETTGVAPGTSLSGASFVVGGAAGFGGDIDELYVAGAATTTDDAARPRYCPP